MILANKSRAAGHWNEVINTKNAIVDGIQVEDGIQINASVYDHPTEDAYWYDEVAIQAQLDSGQEVTKEFVAMLEAEASTGEGGLRFTEKLTRRVSHKATFFGVELGGDILFVLDRSGSMDWASQYDTTILWSGEVVSYNNSDNYSSRRYMSKKNSTVKKRYTTKRLHVMQTEGINALKNLTLNDRFAIISFGGKVKKKWGKAFFPSAIHQHKVNGQTDFVPAIKANVGEVAWKPRYSYDSWNEFKSVQLHGIERRSPAEAPTGIGQFEQLLASGSTPIWSALRKACDEYMPDQLILLADGEPNEGNKNAARILQDFPGWYQPLKDSGCKLYCIYIGTDYKGAQFMQQLAFQNGGEYVAGSK